jgi:hypothetical protein
LDDSECLARPARAGQGDAGATAREGFDPADIFRLRELAVALAPLSPLRRDALDAQFVRVFDGEGTPDDIRDMAAKYGCDVVVIAPLDKAWDNDPFAASPDYRLAEARQDRWRIYLRVKR